MITISICGDSPKEEIDELFNIIDSRNIYDDVALLQRQVLELSERLAIVDDSLSDSGWLPLPLAEGINAQNANTYPCRYRKIGNQVFVEGCVTGFAEVDKVVAILPESFRPSAEYYYQGVAPAGKTDTFRFFKDGRIQRIATTTPSPSALNYHFITTSFFVD